jgi:hypothetical protein
MSAERAPGGDWLEDAVRRLIEGVGAGGGEEAQAGHAPECRSCPVCRGIVALREHGPDVLDQVARVASALAQSLREHQHEQPHEQNGRHPDRAPDAEPPWWGRPPGRGDLPRTERIDITD